MKERNYKNYGGQVKSYREPLTSKLLTLFVIGSRMLFSANTFSLSFEGWKSTRSFELFEQPLPICRRDLNKMGEEFEQLKIEYKEVFGLLETESLGFLEASTDDYMLESFSIDINNKRIKLVAKHKTKNEKRITENITTDEEFDTTLALYPELVAAYFSFVWAFGKANDDFLETLEPIV